MDKGISKSIGNHPAIGGFGENFIKFVYDDSINTFLVIYEIKTPITKSFGKEIQFLISSFSEEQLIKLKFFTKLTAFFVANLELNFFERHMEYAIMVEADEKRVALANLTGELRKSIMGKAGLLAYGSKYDMSLENDIDFYLTFHSELFDVQPQVARNQKEIPEYLLNRPVILKFIESFVNEVYDYAITLWYQIIDGAKELNQLKELLDSFSDEQKSSLKKLGKLIIEDSVLKVAGIFESFDYWLVTQQNGKTVHISYTDPEEEDFERNELAFDMHNEDIINLFSKYGLWTDM